jgi:hypothetical protein
MAILYRPETVNHWNIKMATINELESITIPANDSVIVVTDATSSKKITFLDLKSNIVTPATTTTYGAVKVGTGLNISGSGVLSVTNYSDYILPPATTSSLGGVIIGSGLSVNSEGIVSVASQNIPPASATTYGLVKVGSGLTIVDGKLTAANQYQLPSATQSTLGGVKIGSGLVIDNSVLSTAGRFFISEASQTISENYTTVDDKKSYSIGPISIDRTTTVTINRTATWVIYNPEEQVNPTPPPAQVPIQEQDTEITDNYNIQNNKIATSNGPITIGRLVTVQIAPLSTWIIF